MYLLKKWVLICLLSVAVLTPSYAQPLTAAQTTDLVNKIIKPVLQRNHVLGATVVLYNHGVPQAFYFGTANRSSYNHVNAATVFEIASVTKIFTSVILAYEANNGVINLRDPVVRYLHSAPTTNKTLNQLTVQSLAAHVSGLGQMPPTSIKNRVQLVQSLRNWRSSYKVNSWWRYSNVAFGILGYVLEDVSHQTYMNLMKQVLLTPLHMVDTNMTGTSCHACAEGHSWDGKAVKTTKTLLVIPAAGSLRVSGRDMLKFLSAALNLPGTPPKIAAAFKTTQMPYYNTANGAQGLGWEIHRMDKMGLDGYAHNQVRSLTLHSGAAYPNPNPTTLPGMILYDKTGSVAGFRAYIAIVPSSQTGIAIMVNSAMPRTQVVLATRKVLMGLLKG